MAGKVLDSWALLAFYQDEPAAAEVEKILADAVTKGRKVFLSSVNWTEALAALERAGGADVARKAAAEIAQLPVQIVGAEVDLKLCRLAARLRARHDIGLGAAFAAALALDKHASLATGDPQFRPLAGEITIQWLDTNGTKTAAAS